MKRFFEFLAGIAVLACGSVWAAQTPDAVVSAMTRQVLAQASATGSALDSANLKSMVETTVMPNVDFRAMTARAVGPKWRSATDEQKSRLMAGFEALLIKTYAGAFREAGGAKFRLKSTIALDATTAEVRSDVRVPGREPIALNYRLSLRDDKWKITDVGVFGVWLVGNYQSQFAQVMERSGGIDGLVQVLEERSRPR